MMNYLQIDTGRVKEVASHLHNFWEGITMVGLCVCMYVYLYTCMFIYLFLYMYVCLFVYMYVYLFVLYYEFVV